MTRRLHADQLHVDEALVRRLLAEQFPEFAESPLRPVHSDGTAHAMFRLGDELAVRLPWRPAGDAQRRKEHEWLPRLEPHLPLPIPTPVAAGEPTDEYPCAWSVCRWIEGDAVRFDELRSPAEAARTLGEFLLALRAIDASDGPAPGAHNFERGVPLIERDDAMRAAIEGCADLIDVDVVTQAWERDVRVPEWTEGGVWIHGDLAPGNLVAQDGRLVGVIDWGGLGVGDPATDLLPAWNLFRGESRDAYREALAPDDAQWRRGRGFALSQALIALVYYRRTSPPIVAWATRLMHEVLADHARNE